MSRHREAIKPPQTDLPFPDFDSEWKCIQPGCGFSSRDFLEVCLHERAAGHRIEGTQLRERVGSKKEQERISTKSESIPHLNTLRGYPEVVLTSTGSQGAPVQRLLKSRFNPGTLTQLRPRSALTRPRRSQNLGLMPQLEGWQSRGRGVQLSRGGRHRLDNETATLENSMRQKPDVQSFLQLAEDLHHRALLLNDRVLQPQRANDDQKVEGGEAGSRAESAPLDDEAEGGLSEVTPSSLTSTVTP
jgi:hypothetical protein